MAELSVEINGKMDKLDKALSDSEKALNKFDKKAKKISSTNSKLGSSSNLAAKGMKNLKGQTINGNAAMTAFSRTVQDAPFGIMGVSNNITNLTEQFGYLKNKTGSSGGALKAMLKDLKGFGGITLAISLVTSALLVFGDKIFKTKDKAKELRDEQEKLTKSLDDYVDGLESVERANIKGEQNAQKELTTLSLLKSQIENTNLSINKRKDAIEALRKKYPDYLKNMSDEKILNGGLSTTYNTLTTSIIKRAKATAASNMIVKNSEKLLAIEDKLKGKTNEKINAEKKYNAVIENNKKSVSNYRGAAVDSAFAESGALNALNKLKEEELKLIAQKQNLELTNIDLESNITLLGKIAPELITGDDVLGDDVLKNVFVDFKETYKEEKDKFQELIETDPIILADSSEWNSIDWESYLNLKQLEEQQKLLAERAEQINQIMQQTLVNSVANTLTDLGTAIGQGTANATQLVIGGMGSLLSAMGDKLIQLGTAAILAGTITKLFGSIAGIGAGLAAIAGGVALKAIGTGMTGFAGAGAGADDSGSVSNDTSTFSPSSSGFSGGGSSSGLQNVVFEIQGTKLVGVLSNTLSRNRALGGSLSLT